MEPEGIEDEWYGHRHPGDDEIRPRVILVRAVDHLVEDVWRRQDANDEKGDCPRHPIDQIEPGTLISQTQQNNANMLTNIGHLQADARSWPDQRIGTWHGARSGYAHTQGPARRPTGV
eukprot:scaffold266924_cov28-Tisochrysis_lutea.AAC.1